MVAHVTIPLFSSPSSSYSVVCFLCSSWVLKGDHLGLVGYQALLEEAGLGSVKAGEHASQAKTTCANVLSIAALMLNRKQE